MLCRTTTSHHRRGSWRLVSRPICKRRKLGLKVGVGGCYKEIPPTGYGCPSAYAMMTWLDEPYFRLASYSSFSKFKGWTCCSFLILEKETNTENIWKQQLNINVFHIQEQERHNGHNDPERNMTQIQTENKENRHHNSSRKNIDNHMFSH